ncbi:Uncharacterized protein pbN1_17610 [Aromatoleum bremense]|nr:Uncharacterized protein pbN1_17610 [Aromatoleum bremense]
MFSHKTVLLSFALPVALAAPAGLMLASAAAAMESDAPAAPAPAVAGFGAGALALAVLLGGGRPIYRRYRRRREAATAGRLFSAGKAGNS